MQKYNNEINKQCTKSKLYTNNNQKGITLVVLVVTIVVLLILAGITIANMNNGNGIIEQAKGRKDAATISNEKTILGNATIEATDKFGDITEENLRSALSKNNVEITKSGGLYRIVFKDSNNLYKMNKDGEFFYWEDMAPTDIYWRYTDNTLYLRSSEKNENEITYTNRNTLNWSSSESGVDLSKIYCVIIEEPIAPSTCYAMFANCSKLESIEGIEYLHTENTTSMLDMFYKCSSLKSLDLKYFDTSKVTMMYRMFGLCNKITSINVISFDTSNVTAMPEIFNACNNLENIDVSHWETYKQANLYAFFGACWKLKSLDLSNFDLSKVTNSQTGLQSARNLKTIKTPKKYPSNDSFSIELPKTFYDQEGNAYNSLTSTSPTQTWLYAK